MSAKMAFYMVQKLAEYITRKHMGYEIIYSSNNSRLYKSHIYCGSHTLYNTLICLLN